MRKWRIVVGLVCILVVYPIKLVKTSDPVVLISHASAHQYQLYQGFKKSLFNLPPMLSHSHTNFHYGRYIRGDQGQAHLKMNWFFLYNNPRNVGRGGYQPARLSLTGWVVFNFFQPAKWWVEWRVGNPTHQPDRYLIFFKDFLGT